MTNEPRDSNCDRCNQPRSSHKGLEEFCPFYSTFRRSSREAPREQERNAMWRAFRAGYLEACGDDHPDGYPHTVGLAEGHAAEYCDARASSPGPSSGADTPAKIDTTNASRGAQLLRELLYEAERETPGDRVFFNAVATKADWYLMVDAIPHFGNMSAKMASPAASSLSGDTTNEP